MRNHHSWAKKLHSGWTTPKIVAAAVGGTFLAVILGFLFGWVIEHLWNWLMPMIFGLKPITYWQGVGLFVLAKILFGFGGPGGSHQKKSDCHQSCNDDSGDTTWKIRGSYKDWKLYDRYWNEEGKAAFEAYIERMENNQEEKHT